MNTKEQLINVAMICTGLLLLSSLSGLYSFISMMMDIKFAAFGMVFQVIPVMITVGLFAWGLADLNQYRLTNRENKGIRILRIWVLISAATYPFYTLVLFQYLYTEATMASVFYPVALNLVQTFSYILLSVALYRLHKLRLPIKLADLSTIESANPGKRFLNLLIDTFSVIYFMMSLISPIMLLMGGGDGIEGMIELLMFPLATIASVLYYALTEGVYGQSMGKAVTDTQVYFGPNATSKYGVAWQRSFCRLVPFEVISIFMQDGPWHDAWTETKVADFKVATFDSAEQSRQPDVLDDGFITRN